MHNNDACIITMSVMEKNCKIRKVTNRDIRHGFEKKERLNKINRNPDK